MCSTNVVTMPSEMSTLCPRVVVLLSGSVRKADKLKIEETKRDGDGSTLDPGAISLRAVANTKEDPCAPKAIDKP